jgi:hypothetical protein
VACSGPGWYCGGDRWNPGVVLFCHFGFSHFQDTDAPGRPLATQARNASTQRLAIHLSTTSGMPHVRMVDTAL